MTLGMSPHPPGTGTDAAFLMLRFSAVVSGEETSQGSRSLVRDVYGCGMKLLPYLLHLEFSCFCYMMLTRQGLWLSLSL